MVALVVRGLILGASMKVVLTATANWRSGDYETANSGSETKRNAKSNTKTLISNVQLGVGKASSTGVGVLCILPLVGWCVDRAVSACMRVVVTF